MLSEICSSRQFLIHKYISATSFSLCDGWQGIADGREAADYSFGELMLKKIGGVVALVGLCALSLFLLNCGRSSSRPSGVLYVLTQGTNNGSLTGIGYNVSSFSIDLDNGDLSLVNSNASTCPGATASNPFPCGPPLDILLDPTGASAFVLNLGAPCPEVEVETQPGVYAWVCQPSTNTPIAPTIYPYTVNSDGSLSAPGTAVTWTCPASVTPCTYNDSAVAMVRDASGQFLFVIDQGSYPPPGTGTPATPTTPALPPPYASCPHVPTGPTDVCPSISVFAISSTTLKLASGSPFYLSKLPTALAPITFTPTSGTAQELLFVTNNHDICTTGCTPLNNDNTVSVYTVSSSGVLSEQANSPYAIAATDPISVFPVNTTIAGQNTGGLFVYVGNEDPNGGHIYPFQVCTVVNNGGCTSTDVQDNLLTPLATCPQGVCTNVPPTNVGQDPVQMLVDPTNNFLYELNEGSNQISAFSVSATTGKLSALSQPTLPTGTQPVSMAMHPSEYVDGAYTGQFLYVSNAVSNNITGFSLSTTSGVMSALSPVIAPASPSGIAVH